MYCRVNKNIKSPVVWNIPHSSIFLPKEFSGNFLLHGKELLDEAMSLADLYTDELYEDAIKDSNSIISEVSRIVVDTERFYIESDEPMSKVGMSALYVKTQNGRILRELTGREKEILLERVYKSYHEMFTEMVADSLKIHGKCLIVDCHSFPSIPRPYESDQSEKRPDICIGTDSYHTPPELQKILKEKFESAGYAVKYNSPFSGSIVPMKFYNKDERVSSVMIEINRSLYMDETSFERKNNFSVFSKELGVILKEVTGASEK
ncbi:MAG: N-formylglutamate amidohydrolase [Parcubacteria group bacterium]|nr:N-formylglutamate amidohydrolase [Parcubacteria group bacterium]